MEENYITKEYLAKVATRVCGAPMYKGSAGRSPQDIINTRLVFLALVRHFIGDIHSRRRELAKFMKTSRCSTYYYENLMKDTMLPYYAPIVLRMTEDAIKAVERHGTSDSMMQRREVLLRELKEVEEKLQSTGIKQLAYEDSAV